MNVLFAADDVPQAQLQFIALNAELCKAWPVIAERQEPQGDADDWLKVSNKLDLLER
jgi:ferredoxin